MPILKVSHNLYRIRRAGPRYYVELSEDDGKFWSVQCSAPDERIARAVMNGYVKRDKIPARIVD